MERLPLVLSTVFFLAGCFCTVWSLRTRQFRPSPVHLMVMLAGFGLQTLFLWQRGAANGRCPITNLFEIFIFLSWSMVLLYLLIGTAYRLTLLGAFTAPFVFVFQTFALLAPVDTPAKTAAAHNGWLELHAALSIVAYGAFALACVAGVMFLAQERQIKARQISALFFQLPPIQELAVSIRRLVLAGLCLLAVGLGAGFMVGFPAGKIVLGLGVWALYAALLATAHFGRFSPRRLAVLAVAAFFVTLASLWGIHFLGQDAV